MKLSAPIRLSPTIPFLEKLLFTKHLATMIKSGIPLSEAIESLLEETKTRFFKKVLAGVLSSIDNGQSLAESLKKYPKVFDRFYTGLIEVGEESGTLEENLAFLSNQLAKDYALRKKVKGAMLYPTLIFVAASIMGGFIALFVLPKLVDFFAAFEIELPVTTKVLLFVANTMKDYGLYIVGGTMLAFILLSLFLQLPQIKPHWHKIILKLPLLGQMVNYDQLTRFSRNLGILLQSGVPISRSLEVTADTLSNLKFKNDLLRVVKTLSKGQNIGDILNKKQYDQFPPLVAKMIAVGEKTGKLDESLLYLGDFYEDEIDDLAKNLTTIMEPILLITIGLIVAFIALAIITPIYELTGSIRR